MLACSTKSASTSQRSFLAVEFVEETSVQELLDGVSAVDAHRLSGGSGFGLLHGAFDAVRHEMNSRVDSRPSGGDVVSQDECWPPRVISAPALGDLEGASTGEHGTKSGRETANVLGARPGHLSNPRFFTYPILLCIMLLCILGCVHERRVKSWRSART